MKLIATNRKANFEYFIISTFEAGIVLKGSEVKSIRLGHTNLQDSFITFDKHNECYIKNMHITNYKDATIDKLDEKRSRKLLLNKHEIKKIMSKVQEKGFTLIPLDFYLKNGKVKVKLGVCKGKKQFDKRADIKERDVKRDMQREFRKKLDT